MRRGFLWFIVESLYLYLDGVFYILLSFFLWEQGKSLDLILTFNLNIFVGLLFGGIIFGVISSYLSSKLTYIVSLIIKVLLAYVIASSSNIIFEEIELISFVLGLSYSAYYNSKGILGQLIIKDDQRVKFSSYSSISRSIVSLITPLTVAFLSERIGLESTAQFIMVSLVVLSIIFLFIQKDKYKEKFAFVELLARTVTHKVTRSTFYINFSIGISYAFAWGLLNILILEILGNVSSWSQISFVQAGVAIVTALIIKNIGFDNKAKTKSMITLSTMLFTVFPLILIINFTQTNIIIFILIKVVFDQTINILGFNQIYNMQKGDVDYKQNRISYQMLNDLALNLGQILPILILILLRNNANITITIDVLIITLILTTFIPFLFSNSYKQEYHGEII